MDDDGDDDSCNELVMPWVVVQSEGGPYDDDAFQAGWVCGDLWASLATERHFRGWVPRMVLPQVDLIAMRHELTCTVEGELEDSDLVCVHICRRGVIPTTDLPLLGA